MADLEDEEKGGSYPVLLTPVEVADMLRTTPRTLENMRLTNRGPRYIRLGAEGVAKVVYDLRDVEAWLSRFEGS